VIFGPASLCHSLLIHGQWNSCNPPLPPPPSHSIHPLFPHTSSSSPRYPHRYTHNRNVGSEQIHPAKPKLHARQAQRNREQQTGRLPLWRCASAYFTLHLQVLTSPDCGVSSVLSLNDPVRCKECGHRVMYKPRTHRSEPLQYLPQS
jgi:DNA-directed RNA polymerase subunit RPC12/RpoP